MKKLFSLATLVSLFVPSFAWAHPGHDQHSFFSGLTHPVTGIDHLIMLTAFGLLIGCLNLSRLQKVGLVSAGLVSLSLGLIVGKALGFMVFVEPMIMASLFAVSLCLWQAFSPSTTRVNTAISVAVGFLFFHGYAHGVEAASSLQAFAIGMLITASALMGVGALVGRWVVSKWLSVGVACASVWLMLVA